MSTSDARRTRLRHEFVRHVSDQVDDGVLYISIEFATAVHKCFCGCGQEVVTLFAPTQWTLLFDGASVSLRPSIGNWSYNCQSHYWIVRNRVFWSRRFSGEEIERVRERERDEREAYFARKDVEP